MARAIVPATANHMVTVISEVLPPINVSSISFWIKQTIKPLQLKYNTKISRESVVKETINQLKKQKEYTEEELDELRTLLKNTFKDIKVDDTFIGIKESSVEKYQKAKDDLTATVKFVAEVISVKKKDNKIIEGNPDKIKQVIDYWKFSRNILNKSPNWHLSEIISK